MSNPLSHLPPEQYRVIIEFDAPIEACFAAGTSEAAMKAWVPGFKSVVYDHSKAAEPYGAGSERFVTLTSGVSLVEKVHLSQKPTLLGYHIDSLGFLPDLMMKNYQGRMNYEALGPSKTRLTWIGYFDSSGLREILTRAVLKKMITTMAGKMKIYLAAAGK